MNKETRNKLNSILGLLEIRRTSAERDLEEAINNRRWSEVAGFDGIEIGLLMAKKIIEDELSDY